MDIQELYSIKWAVDSGYTGVIQYIGQWRVVIQEFYSIVGSGQWLYRSYTVYWPVVIQELYCIVDDGQWI